MARRRGRKALYEVMNKSRLKSSAGSQLEPLRQEKAKEETPATSMEDTAVHQESVMWWKKPKLIQINAGRIEISLPYQIAIVVVLFLVLLILAAFRLGQLEQKVAGSTSQVQPGEETNLAGLSMRDAGLNPTLGETILPSEEKLRSAELQGDHVIVLVQYPRRPDLVPVREHFARNGIETEIVQEGNWYFLVTKNRYQNPNNPGTDGYEAKQKIIEIGAKYKGEAPEGYDTFAPHFFSDAYGKKVR